MKIFRRLLPVWLILLVLACQTSDTDLQPKPGRSARAGQAESGGVHKINQRSQPGDDHTTDENDERIDIPDDGSGGGGGAGGGGGPSPEEINQANSVVDQIGQTGDYDVISESNSYVDQLNAMDQPTFNNSFSGIFEKLRKLFEIFTCPVTHGGVELQLNPNTWSSANNQTKGVYLDRPASTATVGELMRWSGLSSTNLAIRSMSFSGRSTVRQSVTDDYQLRRILLDLDNPEMMSRYTRHQAHHLIPWQLSADTPDQHEVVIRAGFAGFHPNEYYNGIMLLRYRISEGGGEHARHPKYNDWVKSQLRQFLEEFPNASAYRCNWYLQCYLIPYLRNEILTLENNNQGQTNTQTLNEYFGNKSTVYEGPFS